MRLADDHRPGLPRAPYRGAVGARRAHVDAGAAHRRDPGHVGVVFDRYRHARQRQFLPGGQPPLHLRRFGHRLVGQDHPKGVQHRVQSGDPIQIERHQFVGRHLTLPYQLRLTRHPGKYQLLITSGSHHPSFRRTGGTTFRWTC